MIIPETIPEEGMFKPCEIAKLFCVPNRRVYEWIKFGNINAVKMGGTVRVPHGEVMAFISHGGDGFINTGQKAVTARMIAAMRGRIRLMVRGNVKAVTSMKLLGCSQDEFRAHIEKQFTSGMTWENYGMDGWTIDHIIPCAQFDLSIPDNQKVCFHYTNLQPLWHIDNIKKGKKYTRRNIRKVIKISHAIS